MQTHTHTEVNGIFIFSILTLPQVSLIHQKLLQAA